MLLGIRSSRHQRNQSKSLDALWVGIIALQSSTSISRAYRRRTSAVDSVNWSIQIGLQYSLGNDLDILLFAIWLVLNSQSYRWGEIRIWRTICLLLPLLLTIPMGEDLLQTIDLKMRILIWLCKRVNYLIRIKVLNGLWFSPIRSQRIWWWMLRGSLLLKLADLNIKIGLVHWVANIWILRIRLRYLCSLICSRFWGKLRIQIYMGMATGGQHCLLPLNILHKDSVLLYGWEISILSKILIHISKCKRLHIQDLCFFLFILVDSLLDSRLIYIICGNRSIRPHIEAIFVLRDILIWRSRAKSCEPLSISRR